MRVSVWFLKLYPSQSERPPLPWEEDVWVTSALQKPLKTTQNWHWQDPKAPTTDTTMSTVHPTQLTLSTSHKHLTSCRKFRCFTPREVRQQRGNNTYLRRCSCSFRNSSVLLLFTPEPLLYDLKSNRTEPQWELWLQGTSFALFRAQTRELCQAFSALSPLSTVPHLCCSKHNLLDVFPYRSQQVLPFSYCQEVCFGFVEFVCVIL